MDAASQAEPCCNLCADPLKASAEDLPQGTRRVMEGQQRAFYYGYWIKAYDPPTETLQERKRLIEGLTRRLFNHVEHGLNIPGRRLNEARRAYDTEPDPKRKRVKGAMLAGALFNRAADIFTKLVEMQSLGIEIEPDNALMRECGEHLLEALSLGKMVLHRSGEEGIDELWGEPFKAFTIPLEDFYESRYVKIALTMRDIDFTVEAMIRIFGGLPVFADLAARLQSFGCAAKIKCETLRTDQDVFELWTSFVVAGEEVVAICRKSDPSWSPEERQGYIDARTLIYRGRDLLSDITRARTPMAKSTKDYIEKCEIFSRKYAHILLETRFSDQA
jgi:hypothetical protein